jgi:ribonuclease T2
MRLPSLILAAGIAAIGLPAFAAPSCSIPTGLAPAPAVEPPPGEVVKGVTNAVYLLSLNWTPQWCVAGGAGASAKEMECDQPFGFTLHGLWPNGVGRPYPRFCNPVGPLDAATVRRMFCRTPSPTLLQHEWQAHGSCGWTDAKAYFAQSARLFDRIALPRIEAIPPDRLTAGAVRAAFVAQNPWLAPQDIYIQTTRDEALTEVRLCYDLAYKPTRCPGGTGAPDGVHIRLAPSRSGAF